ncbi:MAG: POTRA domain-containing protein [Terriglobales bacterium]
MKRAAMRPVVTKPLLGVIFCLSLLTPAAAQKQSSSAAARLTTLKVMGTTRYTDKEILAASGLQIGQLAADGDFKEAVQRLGDSGLFSGVVYSYTSSGTSVKLEFQLTDIDESKLVPAHFDNFVWFTDDELMKELRKRVPLFKLLLPVAGNLPDRVSEALQSILSDRQYPGRVDYLREGDAAGGALHGIDYHVEEVGIGIRGVEFPGASPEQAALLTAAAHGLTGAEYRRTTVAAVAKFDLLPVYLQRGYLKAAFAPSDAHVLSQTSAADPQDRAEIEVDAIIPVTPGKIYSTSGVAWKGNSAISTSEIAPLIHLPTGEPVDAVRLVRDLENVSKLYRSHGYMTLQIKPEAQFDDDKSTVNYDLNIVEGDLYKMGELEILGLDTQTTAQMRAAWALREGQPYNADYPNKFRTDTGKLLPRGVQWTITVHESLEKDKTVDVEIRFKQL